MLISVQSRGRVELLFLRSRHSMTAGKMSTSITFKDIALIVLFGICLPTFDIYSDLAFSINYCTNIYKEGHSLPKLLSVIPLLIPFVFILPHWWRLEGNFQSRIFTFPLLLISCWPQYKMIQILYIGIVKKDQSWLKKKNDFEKDISHIGMFKSNM